MSKTNLKCPSCPRKFKGPQGLAAHLRHNHKDEIRRHSADLPIKPAKSALTSNGRGQLLDGALLSIDADITQLETQLASLRIQRKHVASAQEAEQELSKSA